MKADEEYEAAMVATRYDIIHLADNEWGNELMAQVAQEHFEANPLVQFVEVYEHGGWYLGYRRDGSLWNTANEAARLDVPRPMPKRFSGRSVRREVKA